MVELSPIYLQGLVSELTALPRETEWLEFKTSDDRETEIGEYISALANSALRIGKPKAYLIWGVEDGTHQLAGTNFRPSAKKVGGEELENWLLQRLSPRLYFRFYELVVDEKPIVLLEIDPAYGHPVRFSNEAYIRVGTYKKKLKEFPLMEKEIWRALDKTPFETQIAAEKISGDEVLKLLDFTSYFDLMKLPLPNGNLAILNALKTESLILDCPAGGYNITNLGAILFAKKISEFPSLKRKALRLVQYKGNDRIHTQKEQEGTKGYATGFSGLIDFINAMLPANEVIGEALRTETPMYPEVAIRELVANALIHQDFSVKGAGPMIEIFSDRMEITNPGTPLVSVDRFLDSPPKSRNEILASLMRRLGICEERGSGIDKVVFETEFHGLPAPLFEVPEESTRTVLFAHKDFDDMTKDDKVRACYLHACLQMVKREKMTNKSLRVRFGLEESKNSVVSRIIANTMEAGLIIADPMSESRRDSAYVPFWSSSKELGT